MVLHLAAHLENDAYAERVLCLIFMYFCMLISVCCFVKFVLCVCPFPATNPGREDSLDCSPDSKSYASWSLNYWQNLLNSRSLKVRTDQKNKNWCSGLQTEPEKSHYYTDSVPAHSGSRKVDRGCGVLFVTYETCGSIRRIQNMILQLEEFLYNSRCYKSITPLTYTVF